MDPARWTLIKDALADAEHVPRENLADWLDALAPDLRPDVERLLDVSAAAGVLDQTPKRPLSGERRRAAEGAPDGPDPLIGMRVGPYRIAEPLGRGGMGDVYRARRDDGLFAREVALKLVRGDTDRTALLARFDAERHILARLEHPGIARLLGAGTAEHGPAAGRPWLAMDLVDGTPITDYVRTHDAPRAVRVGLLADVAEAVHHAHQSLVVHRDLKPSNVLVDAGDSAPRAVLLDFGVAKILDPEADLELTRHDGARPMTRRYAAPEQIRGEPATTATDVYALGLLLAEVLTGRRPFDRAGPLEQERAVLGEAPQLPSVLTDASAGGLAAADLRGDLDAVVLRALATNPADRYASAEAFAADLRRHLDGLPVTARPPTLTYRAGRLVGRHRLATAVLAATLAAAIATAALYTVRLATERDRANAAAQQADAVAEVMVQMFDRDPFAAEPERLDTVSVGRFVLARGDAAVAGLRDQPAVQVRLLALLGRLHSQLGDSDRALERARRAVALADSLGGEPSPAAARAYAELGTALEDQGEYRSAEAAYRRALALQRAIYGTESAPVAISLGDLANALAERGDSANVVQAIRVARDGLAIAQRVLGPEHLDVAQAHNNLSAHLFSADRSTEAIAQARRALAIRRSALGDHPLVANTLSNLANALAEENPNESVPLFRDALRVYTVTLGPTHPALATPQYGLSGVLLQLGRLDEAETAARAALDLDAAALPPGHPFLAGDHRRLGEILTRAGKWRQAEASLRRALGVEGSDADLAPARADLGRCLLRTGRAAEARTLLSAAMPHLSGEARGRAAADLRAARTQ